MSFYRDRTLNEHNSTTITVTNEKEINQPRIMFCLRVLAIRYNFLSDLNWWTVFIPKRTEKDIESLKRIIAIYNKEFNANLKVEIE